MGTTGNDFSYPYPFPMKHKYQPIRNEHILYYKQYQETLLHWLELAPTKTSRSPHHCIGMFQKLHVRIKSKLKQTDRRKMVLVKLRCKPGCCGAFRLKQACHRVRTWEQCQPSGNLHKGTLLYRVRVTSFLTQGNHSEDALFTASHFCQANFLRSHLPWTLPGIIKQARGWQKA